MQPDGPVGKRIVVVSSDSSHAAAVRRVCGWWRYDVVWTREPQSASRLLAVPGAAVLIACQAAGAQWADSLDQARKAVVPLIMVLPEFDARLWLDLLRAGVSEVLAEPLTQAKIGRALGSTIGFDANSVISLAPLLEAGRRLLGM